MRKVIAICITLTLVLALLPSAFAAASDVSGMSTEELLALILAAQKELAARRPSDPAPEEILQSLKDAGLELEITEIFTEETDVNHALGRPGKYTGKADFAIGSVEKNTIETFADTADCAAREKYLSAYTDASLGAFGLNQYIYKADLAILRISYEITPTKAEEYGAVFYAFTGKEK